VFRSYNVNNLMEDLKLLYRVAGADGKGITFIFTDNEIKDEGFLEFINNVLSSGEVANLFAKDEIDEIQQNLVPVMKKEMPRRPPTSENLYDYFLSRAKNNLHVVLCFSPVSHNLLLTYMYSKMYLLQECCCCCHYHHHYHHFHQTINMLMLMLLLMSIIIIIIIIIICIFIERPIECYTGAETYCYGSVIS